MDIFHQIIPQRLIWTSNGSPRLAWTISTATSTYVCVAMVHVIASRTPQYWEQRYSLDTRPVCRSKIVDLLCIIL